MNRTRLSLLIGLGLLVAGGLAFWLWPRPAEAVTGDAWDYRLVTADLPAGWTFSDQAALTPYDLANTAPAQSVLTPTASLAHLRQLYSQSFTPPEASQYGDLTADILLYQTAADARASLSGINPGAEWEGVAAPALGEQSRVWRYRSPDSTLDQNLYRVDFRYLNAIGSVTMVGTRQALPSPDQPVSYARQVLTRLQQHPTPPELDRLQAAGAPDLRGLLLTQTQMAQVDSALGNRWSVNGQYLAAWVNNADFPNAEARTLLDQLGRVTGYESYWIKSLTPAEQPKAAGGLALFQQVSAYPTAAAALSGLKALTGPQGVDEIKTPPHIGDHARAWRTLLKNGADTLALSEISFQVGRYVATVQLQSPPLTGVPNLTERLTANYSLAEALAQTLTVNVRAAP